MRFTRTKKIIGSGINSSKGWSGSFPAWLSDAENLEKEATNEQQNDTESSDSSPQSRIIQDGSRSILDNDTESSGSQHSVSVIVYIKKPPPSKSYGLDVSTQKSFSSSG